MLAPERDIQLRRRIILVRQYVYQLLHIDIYIKMLAFHMTFPGQPHFPL